MASTLALILFTLTAAPPDEDLERDARRSLERGDYAESESIVRRLLENAGSGTKREAMLRAQLAHVLVLQGALDEAGRVIAAALEVSGSSDVRRIAALVHLRAQSYAEALPHLDAAIRSDPEDAWLRFSRGLALVKTGRPAEALEDLGRALRDPAMRRDAHFELALALAQLGEPRRAAAHLVAILEQDPYDDEACYQLSRQLIRAGDRDRARTAALLMRYFGALRERIGESTRDHHLAATGHAVGAAIERAARRERLGDLAGAHDELDDARRRHPDDPELALALAGFWLRRGLIAEANAELERLPPAAPAELADRRAELARAGSEIAARIDDDLRGRSAALAEARRRLADARWSDAREPLEEVLEAASTLDRPAIADDAARLLLARDPRSAPALRYLVDRTRDPSLLPPHLHFLARLAKAEPGNPAHERRRARLVEAILGK